MAAAVAGLVGGVGLVTRDVDIVDIGLVGLHSASSLGST